MVNWIAAAAAAAGAAASLHTAWAVQKYGLHGALSKSMQRKGSFTAPLDHRRWAASLLHFWAIWGEAVARENAEGLPEPARDSLMRDWHGWYWSTSGDVNRGREGGGVAVLQSLARAEGADALPWVSESELADHADKWVVVEGLVLDVARFALRHPGGQAVLQRRLGTDATEHFRALQHSAKAGLIARSLAVGRVMKPRQGLLSSQL